MPADVGIGLRSQHSTNCSKTPVRRSISWKCTRKTFCVRRRRSTRYVDCGATSRFRCTRSGLSLGSADGVDEEHLEQVARLVDELQPALVSEHLSWSWFGRAYFNDLLPLPYTEEALDIVARNVGRLQDRLGRQVAIENPSAYLGSATSTLTEAEFLDELVRRSGCGLLLDINNVAVTAHNIGLDPAEWLNELPGEAIVSIIWPGMH